jgi:hypothetical protein
MIQYPAANPNTPPLKWDKSAVFIWGHPDHAATNPKIYRASVAKAEFTRSHTDYIHGSYDGTRPSWQSGKGVKLPQGSIDVFMRGQFLYKLINDTWVCVYQPDSPAGWEYVNGNLTVRELRDSIDW